MEDDSKTHWSYKGLLDVLGTNGPGSGRGSTGNIRRGQVDGVPCGVYEVLTRWRLCYLRLTTEDGKWMECRI